MLQNKGDSQSRDDEQQVRGRTCRHDLNRRRNILFKKFPPDSFLLDR